MKPFHAFQNGIRWLRGTLPYRAPSAAPCVGIDIGENTLRLVELAKQQGEWQLARYHIEPYVALNNDTSVSVDIDHMAQSLRTAWRRFGCPARDVAIAIPSSMACYKLLAIQPDAGSVAEQVHAEISRLVPFDLNDVTLDFQLIDHLDSQEHKHCALICAARRDSVEERVAIVELAGLNAWLVDVECFAYIKALAHSDYAAITGAPGKMVALFDIAPHSLQCHILKEAHLIYYRQHALHAMDINTLRSAIERALHVFNHTVSLTPPQYIKHILLAGSVLPPGGSEALTQHLGCAVSRVCPVVVTAGRIDTLAAPVAASLMVAYGLALRGVDR